MGSRTVVWGEFLALVSAGVGFRDFSTEYFNFLLQGLHTLLDILHSFANFLRRISRDDVLRAVPVICFDVDHEYPLDYCLLFRNSNAGQPTVCLMALEDLRPAEYLKTGLSRVIDENERHAIVAEQVSGGNVLFVPTKVRESECAIVDHL